MTRACTVVTRRTARAAQVMAESFTRHHPGSRLTLVDVDGALRTTADLEWDVRRVDDLGIPPATLRRAALYLDDDGFAAWLKPHALLLALADDTTVTWLDPTSLLLGSVGHLDELGRRHGLVVVPRAPSPLPDDDLEPRAADLPRTGHLAGSLLVVSAAVAAELEWWAARAERDTDAVPWLDQAGDAVDHLLLRAADLAVSAWSVGGDQFSDDGDGLRLRGTLVRHIDLAGFDPTRPWLLDSRLCRPRVLLSRQPALARFCSDYADQVLGRDAAEHSRFGTLGDGIVVTPQVRRAYRRALDEGEVPPTPFEPGGDGTVVDWLLEPVPATDPPLTRYLRSIHLDRPDLQASIPGVPHQQVTEMLAWSAEHGRHEPDYDAALIDRSLAVAGYDRVSPRRPRQRTRPTRRKPPRGVNVVGHLRGELGIGESARLMLAALSAAGIRHAATPVVRHLQSRQDAAFPATPLPSRPFDTTLLCVNADLTPEIAREIPELMRARHRIGMWYWEVEAFPASLHGAFSQVDEVWAATDFIRDALLPHATVPVHTVTPPLPVPARSTALTRVDLGLPDGYLFLFSFDYLSTAERKNPLGLVEAFRRAFPRGSGPVLVIKSINADERVLDAERLRTAVASEPDIVLMEDYLDAATRDALMVLTDCYVSLHRSEGLGLTMAEAMALGKPVIATGYGGNLQFMTEQNSYLVPWTAVPIPEGCAPYPPGTPWAQPDLDEAAARMRTVFDDPTSADVRGARAAHDIATRHSPDVAGRAIARQLRRSSPLRSMAGRLRGRVRRGPTRS